MLGFAIKKTFFDLWDNLFFAMTVNLLYTLAALGLTSLAYTVGGTGMIAALTIWPMPLMATAILGGIASFWARDIALSGTARFSDVLTRLGESWKVSLVFGAAWLVVGLGLYSGVGFYTQINPILGFVFGVIMVWILFFLGGLGMYLPGLNAQIEPKIGKLFRKSLLVFIANPLTSLVMVLVLAVSLVLTVFTFGFFPGIIGISLWFQVCFKFILAKLEWIEANPEADRKHVPWKVILQEDMERIGPRSLKSLLFPWKD